ncbi:MAG: hypothetical protein ACI37O_08445, partial [Candidatus Avelusimicrobium sp.]|uniref:hypothetical protein n=1 Tax=Candidatus Avelusimicrobium sp. TaxID=3048833 RepID=UPI003F05BD59
DRRACTAGDTCGFETRTATCDASTGEWKYGSWKASACAAKPTKTSQTCSSCGGQQSITYTCNKDSGAWESALGDCDKPEDECEQTCTGEEKRTDVGGPYEYKNPPTRADTCDGDKKTMFSCGNKPTVCYDVYSTVIGSMTIGGAVTCGGTQKNCAVGYQNACIDGAWRCIVRCPDGGCADGTLNPAEGGETTSGGGFRLVYFVDKVVCCDADQVKLGDLGKLEVVK